MADDVEWVEWGVRRTWGDVGSVANFGRYRIIAERAARDWPGELVRRVVRADDWTTTTRCDLRHGQHETEEAL